MKLVTAVCWRLYTGASFEMLLVTFSWFWWLFKCTESVINISNRPSAFCHQHQPSTTSANNIDVATCDILKMRCEFMSTTMLVTTSTMWVTSYCHHFCRWQSVIIEIRYEFRKLQNWSNWGIRFWISSNWLGSIDYVYVMVYE